MPPLFQSVANDLPAEADHIYYARLMQGALYLAGQAGDAAEAQRHLAMAARYRMQCDGLPYPPLRRAAG